MSVSFDSHRCALPTERDQRCFFFTWLGVIVFLLAFCVVLFYVFSRMLLS